MTDEINALLQRLLSADDVSVLQRLAPGDLRQLFVYDAESRRFEPADGEFGDEELDALLRASEALTAHRDELPLRAFASPPRQERMKDDLQYRFGSDELELYEAFRRVLEQHVAPDEEHRIEYGMALDGPIVTVTLVSRTDVEYHAARERIRWLFELAKRQVTGEPYKGHRPY